MWIDPPLDALKRSTKNQSGRLSPATRLPTDKTNTQGLNITFHLLTSNKSNVFHIVYIYNCILNTLSAILINNNKIYTRYSTRRTVNYLSESETTMQCKHKVTWSQQRGSKLKTDPRTVDRSTVHWRCVVQQWSDPQTWIKIVDRSTVKHAPGRPNLRRKSCCAYNTSENT